MNFLLLFILLFTSGECFRKLIKHSDLLNNEVMTIDYVSRSLNEPILLNFHAYDREFKLILEQMPECPLIENFSVQYYNESIRRGTYRGKVEDDDLSLVFGSIRDGIFEGIIRMENGEEFWVDVLVRHNVTLHSINYPTKEKEISKWTNAQSSLSLDPTVAGWCAVGGYILLFIILIRFCPRSSPSPISIPPLTQMKHRKDKHIPTVSMARKIAKRRARRRNNIDEIVLRLKLLGSNWNVNRVELARSILKFKGGGVTSTLKTLLWIANESFRLISMENDSTILLCLLRFVIAAFQWMHVIDGCGSSSIPSWRFPNKSRLVKQILAKEPGILIRLEALLLVRYDLECHEDVVEMCCSLIEKFRERNGRLMAKSREQGKTYMKYKLYEDAEVHLAFARIEVLLEYEPNDNNFLPPHVEMIDHNGRRKLMRNEVVMGMAFDVMKHESTFERTVKQMESAPEVFIANLLYPPCADDDRVYLLNKYTDELKLTFRQFSARNLNVALAIYHFIPLFAKDEVVMNTIWRRMINGSEFALDFIYVEVYTNVTMLLDYAARRDGPLLEELIGQGYLKHAVCHYSKAPYIEEGAPVFRRILDLHPELKQIFKKWTKDGYRMNDTTRLGRRIKKKKILPAVNYFFK